MGKSQDGHSTVSTGVAGLDDILAGGLPAGRLYLLQGDPGTGKTTIALRFLLAGVKAGERVIYVTLSESRKEIEGMAASHGWSLDGITLYGLDDAGASAQPEAQQTLFHPAEVELNETMRGVLEVVERTLPTRVVFDSLSEMRLLARDPLRYRRLILSLKQLLLERDTTVLLLDDRATDSEDRQLQSLVHGVIQLEQAAPEYGAERRRLRVVKLRGIRYRSGFHDFTIVRGGLVAFPRLIAAEHHRAFEADWLRSGVDALDRLLGGGLDRGASTLLMGPAGVGKSSLVTRYVRAAADRGERAAVFVFDEGTATFLARARGLAMDLSAHVQGGRVHLQQVDPTEMAPGEFAHAVRQQVEAGGASVVAIDSLNGYMAAMHDERAVVAQFHELLSYLRQVGVSTLIVVGQHGLTGPMASPVDVSYLADTVLLLRYFEFRGAVRQAISVVKKRAGPHERTIRELGFTSAGVTVGEPLQEFVGVLSGVPALVLGDAPGAKDPDEPRR
jgi:circadian clock protein KaiC